MFLAYKTQRLGTFLIVGKTLCFKNPGFNFEILWWRGGVYKRTPPGGWGGPLESNGNKASARVSNGNKALWLTTFQVKWSILAYILPIQLKKPTSDPLTVEVGAYHPYR